VKQLRNLAEHLHALAKDHDHATAMIHTWLRTQTRAPRVVNLVNLAATVPSSPRLPGGCNLCHGDLWVITDRGAARCTCVRGKALSYMDRCRQEETRKNAVRYTA
jgi:hypothetical protein